MKSHFSYTVGPILLVLRFLGIKQKKNLMQDLLPNLRTRISIMFISCKFHILTFFLFPFILKYNFPMIFLNVTYYFLCLESHPGTQTCLPIKLLDLLSNSIQSFLSVLFQLNPTHTGREVNSVFCVPTSALFSLNGNFCCLLTKKS